MTRRTHRNHTPAFKAKVALKLPRASTFTYSAPTSQGVFYLPHQNVTRVGTIFHPSPFGSTLFTHVKI